MIFDKAAENPLKSLTIFQKKFIQIHKIKTTSSEQDVRSLIKRA